MLKSSYGSYSTIINPASEYEDVAAKVNGKLCDVYCVSKLSQKDFSVVIE